MNQMRSFAPIATSSEDEVTGNPRIFGIVIAESFQGKPALDPGLQRRDAEQDVENGFCSESFHRGGAVVLDATRDSTYNRKNTRTFRFERGSPVRIGID